jgi:hypothetical protein
MVEANELFSGWADFPPTNLLLKGLLEGLGGGTKPAENGPNAEIPAEAQLAMQQAALTEIAAKAGPRIPITRGRDKGLPKTQPTFDPDALRERNALTASQFRKAKPDV